MADTLSSFSPAQKEKYIGIVNEVLNSREQLWGWIDKVPADGGGVISTQNTGATGTTTQRGLHFTVHLGRNATGSWQDPEGAFPTASNQTYVQGYMQGRTMYWPLNVSRAAIARTKSDDVAYARVMVESAIRTGNDVRNELERTVWGDGSGTLGTLTGALSGGGPTYTATLDNYQDMIKFSIGQVVSIFTNRTNAGTKVTFGSGATFNDVAKITAINLGTSPNFTVTLSAVAGTFGALGTAVAAGAVMVKASVDSANASATINGERTGGPGGIRYGMMGIDGIILDCDSPMESGGSAGLYGILATSQYGTGTINGQGNGGTANAAGFPTWQSYVNRNSTSRAYNDALLQSLLDRPMIDYGEQPTCFATSYGGRWEYVNSKLGIRRYVNTPSLSGSQQGGFTEDEGAKSFPEYHGLPIIPGRFAQTWNLGQLNTLCTNFYAVNLNTLKGYEWHPVRFMDDDGLTWRMIQRTPFFEAILEYTVEMMTVARNSHAKAINVIATNFN